MNALFFNLFIILFMSSSSAFSATLVASDVDPSGALEQISLIVASIVSFLVFLMGSKRVLKFLG
jgi:hypothetical protein